LSDGDKRTQHDQFGHAGPGGQGFGVSVVLKTFLGLAIFLICSLVVGVVLVIQMHLSKVLIYNTRWCWISKKPFLEKKQKLQFLRKKNVILVMDQVLNLELK